MTYFISVTETLNRVVAVEASNLEEAFERVENAANSGEVELTADDFVGRDVVDETEETEEMIRRGIVDQNRFQKVISE